MAASESEMVVLRMNSAQARLLCQALDIGVLMAREKLAWLSREMNMGGDLEREYRQEERVFAALGLHTRAGMMQAGLEVPGMASMADWEEARASASESEAGAAP